MNSLEIHSHISNFIHNLKESIDSLKEEDEDTSSGLGRHFMAGTPVSSSIPTSAAATASPRGPPKPTPPPPPSVAIAPVIKIGPDIVMDEEDQVDSGPVNRVVSVNHVVKKATAEKNGGQMYRPILPRPKIAPAPATLLPKSMHMLPAPSVTISPSTGSGARIAHRPLPDPLMAVSSGRNKPGPKPKAVYVHDPKLVVRPDDKFWRVEIPAKTLIVIVQESEIGGGCIKNTKCIECREPLEDYDTLKAHYLQVHPWLWSPKIEPDQEEFIYRGKKPRGSLMGWSYRFYCPIPGCSHHMLYREKWKAKKHQQHFPKLYQLTQHYVKVHAERQLRCPTCPQSFSVHNHLRRHMDMCGLKFPCGTCDSVYNDDSSLMTHCRRKGHIFINPLKTSQQSMVITPVVQQRHLTTADGIAIGAMQEDDEDEELEVDHREESEEAATAASGIGRSTANPAASSGGLSSPPSAAGHQMSAAIALSQLSSGQQLPAQLPPAAKRLKQEDASSSSGKDS